MNSLEIIGIVVYRPYYIVHELNATSIHGKLLESREVLLLPILNIHVNKVSAVEEIRFTILRT